MPSAGALPTLDTIHHSFPGTTVVRHRGEEVVHPVEQDGSAKFSGLQRRRLNGPQEYPRLAFTKYLDTELPAPAGQGLLRRQRRPSLIDLKGGGLCHWSLLNAAGCIAPPRGQPVA